MRSKRKSLKMLDIANPLFEQFSLLAYDGKIELFKEYLDTYSSYAEVKGCILIEDDDMESIYLKFCAEKDKVRTRIFLLSQFIDNDKLKELIYANGMDERECQSLYDHVIVFKEKFELLENARLPKYQNVFDFVVYKLKKYFYDKNKSNFNFFKKINKFIDEYISENKSKNNKINFIDEESKELMYAEINKKFYSILECDYPDDVENPSCYEESQINQAATICGILEKLFSTGNKEQSSAKKKEVKRKKTRKGRKPSSKKRKYNASKQTKKDNLEQHSDEKDHQQNIRKRSLRKQLRERNF
uniref:Uncharacterized protein n=1 Tax=Strongyloides stercoralis TaxID=6248 RepID=A0A0K0E6C2_STRER